MTTTEQVLTKIGLKGTNTTYEVKDEVARNLVAQAQTAANEAKSAAEAMQSQITEKESEITSLEGQLSTTQETLTSTQSQLATVQGQIATLNEENENLKNQVKNSRPETLAFELLSGDILFDELSWEDINSISSIVSNNESLLKSKIIGKTKPLEIPGYGTVDMRVCGINHDKITESQKATFSFISEQTFTKHFIYNSTSVKTSWKDCQMRSWLNNTIFSCLPENIRSCIKPVIKTYSYQSSSSTVQGTCTDKLWLPSATELGATANSNYVPTEGTRYESGSTKKKLLGGTQDSRWWSRTVTWIQTKTIAFTGGSGDVNLDTGTYELNDKEYGVALCFCI